MSADAAYSVFIQGETVDLCVPSEAAVTDGWANWFNDQRTTRYIPRGVFPNHIEDQREFLELIRKRERFAALICSKGGATLYGVVSLSMIDWSARSAQLAVVVGRKRPGRQLMFLEALALGTEHGFQRMGLDRIWARQAYPGRARFNQHMELLGFFPDAMTRRGFVKGRETVGDAVMITCLYEDYVAVRARRGGHYWPGTAIMLRLIGASPRGGFADRLAEFMNRELPLYKAEIQTLEQRAMETDDLLELAPSRLSPDL